MRDPASISNAVSEGEKITLAEAVVCIRWLQKEFDRVQNARNRLVQEISVTLARDLAEREGQ